jgi:peroxiredoxin
MKKLMILVVSFLALTAFVDDSVFPNATLKTMEGKSVQIQDEIAKNDFTLISFWATWCAPCKRELDALAEVYPTWKKEYNFNVIAVTVDDARGFAKVPALVKSKNWEYTILSDGNQSLQQSMNFTSIPQTFLVDREGNIVYSHTGYSPGDEFELEVVLKKLKK